MPNSPKKKTTTKAKAPGSVVSTVAGPSTTAAKPPASAPAMQKRRAAAQRAEQAAAAAMPANPLKAGELDPEPKAGVPLDVDGASTATEENRSTKSAALDRMRADGGGQPLTTGVGVEIGDNQSSLKAGARGPTLMEDFILREKITHFDHERIPERVVHARGSAAHGFFESYGPIPDLTRATVFAEKGKRTPVFVRFSTVAGERGSFDLARDVRGFAVKFYTDEGNWDLVGNNMPVFFIQDAMKFPDLVHAVKPEPHHGMPQAASAHDTFWDFVSLMPESTHMLMWVMSDRAIPRSYRMMQGFGVHTFRLVNAKGQSRFCKFHWNPVAGTHSVVWDEAVKVNGADPDFHRRDLWEAIESGNFPEWELGLQVFTEEQAERFSFDVLDATKLIPEELVPVKPVGRMVLDRNPDNFFAETEQVAFGTMNLIPGIDTSDDPLLQGRHHSYFDTQLTRLGGPNFQEIPINRPVAPVHNNQRDGLHRETIARGRVAYEPNSLGGGCPFQAGMRGFTSFPAEVGPTKVRVKPEKFADHFTQARLFYKSQTPPEQRHIAAAFRFELTKVQTRAVRERVLSLLVNVDAGLAQEVANGLGMPVPPGQKPVLARPAKPEVEKSPALSLMARPGALGARTRTVALLVAEGIDAGALKKAHAALLAAGAVPRFVSARLGTLEGIDVEVTLETAPSAVWDGVVVPPGDAALAALGQAKEFLENHHRHCKPMLLLGTATAEAAGLPEAKRPATVAAFIAALGAHRDFSEQLDPPPV